ARRRAVRLAGHVEERDLADRGRDAAVRRRGRERVAATHRRAERDDAVGQRAREGDRGRPVLQLAGGLEAVPLAAAVAEAAVVEDERAVARRGESLGERPEAVAARA